MPVRIEIADAASRDLTNIGAHLSAEAGPHVAGRWILRLQTRISGLREFPHAGAEDDRLGAGRRRLVERPYLIVYQVLGSELVRVLRVVHGARDLPGLFNR